MIDWNRITGFVRDSENERKTAEKHYVEQAEAEAEHIFFNEPLMMLADHKHSYDKTRIHALGQTDSGRLLQVTFTLRGSETKIRVISARTMSRKERAYYDKQN